MELNEQSVEIELASDSNIRRIFLADYDSVIYDTSPRISGKPARYWMRKLFLTHGKCALPRGISRNLGIKSI